MSAVAFLLIILIAVIVGGVLLVISNTRNQEQQRLEQEEIDEEEAAEAAATAAEAATETAAAAVAAVERAAEDARLLLAAKAAADTAAAAVITAEAELEKAKLANSVAEQEAAEAKLKETEKENKEFLDAYNKIVDDQAEKEDAKKAEADKLLGLRDKLLKEITDSKKRLLYIGPDTSLNGCLSILNYNAELNVPKLIPDSTDKVFLKLEECSDTSPGQQWSFLNHTYNNSDITTEKSLCNSNLKKFTDSYGVQKDVLQCISYNAKDKTNPEIRYYDVDKMVKFDKIGKTASALTEVSTGTLGEVSYTSEARRDKKVSFDVQKHGILKFSETKKAKFLPI